MKPLPLVLIAVVVGSLALAVYLIIPPDGERTNWRLAEAPAGTELHLDVEIGGCDGFDRFAVLETDTTVTINAYVRNDVRSSCDHGIFVELKVVELEAPVGGRELRGCSPPDAIYGADDSADCSFVRIVGKIGRRALQSANSYGLLLHNYLKSS